MKNAAAVSPLIEKTRQAARARNLQRLHDLGELIRRRVASVVESFYDIGDALREVVDHKLYAAEGHARLEAWLDAQGVLSIRHATKLITVARHVSRAHALALGQERAYALVAYVRTGAANDNVDQLVAAGGTVGDKPVTEASVRDIVAATRAARAKRAAKTKRGGASGAREVEHALRTELHAAGLRDATVRAKGDRVRVELTRAQAERLARRLGG